MGRSGLYAYEVRVAISGLEIRVYENKIGDLRWIFDLTTLMKTLTPPKNCVVYMYVNNYFYFFEIYVDLRVFVKELMKATANPRNEGKMLKRKPTDRPLPEVKPEIGGLADTNCGILIREIVATRSWIAVLSAILLASLFFRAAVGLGGYSGPRLSSLWN